MSAILLKNFSNQYVEIITKRDMITESGNAPLIVNGFLIDADLDFVYLGLNNSIQIDSAIRKDDIVVMSITDPESDENTLFSDSNESDGSLN